MGRNLGCAAVLSFMIFVFGVGIVAGRYYRDNNRRTQNPAEYREEKHLFLEEVDVVAQWVVAIGTLVLLGVTLHFNRKALIHAIDSSNKSLKLTKKSLKTAVNQERPCLLVNKVHYFHRLGEHDIIHASFQIKNFGRTVGIIEQIHHEFAVSNYKVRDVSYLTLPEDPCKEYIPILPGEIYHGVHIAFISKEDVERFASMEKVGRQAVMQSALIYRDSAGSTYRHRFTAWANKQTRTSGNGGDIYDASIDMSKGHWEDGPWRTPPEPPPHYSDKAD